MPLENFSSRTRFDLRRILKKETPRKTSVYLFFTLKTSTIILI